MDDMFGMLFSTLPPEKKLLTAITSNMLDSLDSLLLGNEVDVNARLLTQGGNTALHVAAQKGYHACLRRLLLAGANPDKVNDFGFSPLALALRCNYEECVQVLFRAGGDLSDPMLVWQAEQTDGLPKWIGYSHSVIEVLLVATPNFNKVPKNLAKDLYDHFFTNFSYPELIKIYFILGNKVPTETKNYLLMNSGINYSKWLRDITSSPLSLQHYSRLAIRRHMKLNVFYSSQHLQIPKTLQDYLISTADMM